MDQNNNKKTNNGFFLIQEKKISSKKSPFDNFGLFSFKILYLGTKFYFFTFQSMNFKREKRKLHGN